MAKYVFTMTGAVVDSDKPLAEPLFKPVAQSAKPKTAAKKTAARKAAKTAQEG